MTKSIEVVLAWAKNDERFAEDAVSHWQGTPLRDLEGQVIGELASAWVDDEGRTIRARFNLQPREETAE